MPFTSRRYTSLGRSVSPTKTESRTGATTSNNDGLLPDRLTHPSAVAAARDNANTYRFMAPKCKGSRLRRTRPVGTTSGPLPLWKTGGRGLPRPPLEHRHREERPEVVVGHTQPGGQQPYHRPQHLVGDIAIEIEQQLEVGAGDGDQRTGGI